MQIYPSITTIIKGGYQKKINEAKKFKITELCFFPTSLNQPEREKAYGLMRAAKISSVPLVHLRHEDMDKKEINYLIREFKVKAFNLHAVGRYGVSKDYGRLNKKIYLENAKGAIDEIKVKKFGGLCLDTAHLESLRFENNSLFQRIYDLFGKYTIGCCHVSAVYDQPYPDMETGRLTYEGHLFNKLKEFNHLAKYKNFLPAIVALEVENSLRDQLRAKKYLEKILHL